MLFRHSDIKRLIHCLRRWGTSKGEEVRLRDYIKNRSRLFTMDSEFSCPDRCNRFGCKDERLHVSVSIIDMVAASLVTGKTTSDLFGSHFKIGASPMDENPWIQRFVLELKKPCPFLAVKDCGIYRRRPITCALFPEAFFLFPGQEGWLNREKFGHYPCLRKPPMISEKRRSNLVALMETARREAFLTEFYFFGFSPFCVDLRNTAVELMEVSQQISGSIGGGEERYDVPHEAFEQTLINRLGRGGYLAEINAKVERLNSPRNIEALYEIKELTDTMAVSDKDFPYCYEFDERDRLKLVKRPI